VRFIATHKDDHEPSGLRWGVQSMCAVLTDHGCPIAASTNYEQLTRTPSRRQLRDEHLSVEIERVHAANYGTGSG